jgi:hypothetical protein
MYFSRIVEAITRWGVLVLIPVLGVVLYWVRAHFRLTYGISEFLVGLITATRVILPKFQFDNLEVVAILQILGGLYIMVRGLDNVEKGLRGSRLQPVWQQWFGDS